MTNGNREGEQLTEGESGSEGEEERESTQRGEKRKKRLGLAKGIFIVQVDSCKYTPHFSTSWFTPTHSRTHSADHSRTHSADHVLEFWNMPNFRNFLSSSAEAETFAKREFCHVLKLQTMFRNMT